MEGQMRIDRQVIEQLCRAAKADGALHGVALAAGSRNSLDLHHWEFTYTPDFDEDALPETFEAHMPVPGIWDDHLDALRGHAFFSAAAWNPQYKPMMDFPVPFDGKLGDASLPYLHGTGWYRRVFSADAPEPASRYVLNVGPARMETQVWVNRKLVGCHKGHNTPFRLDITEAVTHDRPNELVIAVTNTCTDRFGCDTRGFQGQSGGITGDTWIDLTGAAFIDDLFVHEESAETLRWRVLLGGCVPEHATLRWRIERQDGQEADRGTHDVADPSPTWTSDATGLARWSDVDPVLHRLVLVLEADGRVLDRREQPAGFRCARVQGRGLMLNDLPIYLRGGTEHCYYPETCTPPTDKAAYVVRVKAWKRLGINWLRCHTWVPGEPFLEAADELGVLVQVEPARGYSLEEWAAIVRTCRKHPSVILYCCGNEEWLDDRKIDFLEQCQRLLKALAPDALFNPQEALRGVEYGWDMDLASDEERAACVDEPFRHHPARLNRLREFCDAFGNYPWGKFSYSSCYGDLARLDNQMSVYGRPLLGHEIGILGTYIDLSLESRYAGTRIGTDLYAKVREHLAASGVLDLAPVYFRNSCRQMVALVKDLLESARMCTCLAGYDWLAPSDHHWHRSGYHCGVLNEFQEAKWEAGIADIIAVNSASVLLLDHRRVFNLAAGRPVSLPLILSLYGARPIENAEVTWRVVDSAGGVLAHGGWTTGPIANGGNARLGDVDWVPQTDAPRAVTLEAGLQAANLHLANRWTFWIFTVVAEAPAAAGVHVVDSLSQETVGILERGGRVVLLGPGPFPALETRFQPSIAGRQTGDSATLIHSHPALGDFPHEGFCDWQFKPLRDGSHNIVFDDLGVPFDPIIDIASSYKHVSRRAALFELAVGAGRLLVCSLNLAADDVAARHLKRQLIRYAASDRFAPPTSLSAERLRRIIQGERAIEAEAQTDMAFDPNASAPPVG